MPDPTVADVYNQLVACQCEVGSAQYQYSRPGKRHYPSQWRCQHGFQSNCRYAQYHRTDRNSRLIEASSSTSAQQTDTMICALEHISQNTCGILTQVTIQTQLQKRIRDDADALRDIAESAYPSVALERQRLAKLRAQVERCCPPEEPRPACTYEPCPQPKPLEVPEIAKNPQGV